MTMDEDPPVIDTDVLIVGSGPVGATYARILVEAGVRVHMIEVGSQESPIPGEHKKNAINFQKDVNQFVNVIQGDLFTLSVPVQPEVFPNIDPTSVPGVASLLNGSNPEQLPQYNLDGKATRGVGGMSAHWTCCTPEMKAGIELPECYTEKEWKDLYVQARHFIKTSSTQFDDSIRQQLVKRTLQDAFHHKRDFYSMPLACERQKVASEYVRWSSTATVLEPILKDMEICHHYEHHQQSKPLFTLMPEHLCTKVVRGDDGQIKGALVTNLRYDQQILIRAKKYVICAGAVLTPQILYNSGFESTHGALGHYMTEQVMTFCQIIMKDSLIQDIRDDKWHLGWKKIVEEHCKKHPKDPLPIPFRDPDPQVTTHVTEETPWHTQIHRDAFSYGLVPDIYDQRTIVDLRWFGYVKPVESNCVTFSKVYTDMYGMPQPTFHYELGPEDKERANAQMTDMLNVSTKLGGFLPGAGPQFLTPGSALHICGTTRVGEDIKDSVVDKHCRVHGCQDLFLGGCNVIPTQNAVNPTLTAIGFAIVGANTILKELK